ncbi:NosD domain-containing protein [Bacillus paralicheniformis]|uniref:NosD domain-containing protein n=1 Tax=Bacillus paralicheniformis TaxID=1648923 RepID=UPI0036272123
MNGAIQIVCGRNVFISDNRIFGGRRGIWVESCFNTFISNNYISCADTEAVYVAKSSDTSSTIPKSTHLSIDRNEINTIGRNGVYVQTCDNFDVRNNNIFNTNIEQGSKDRGGVFVEKAYGGRIKGNRIRGVEKIFATLGQYTATEVSVFNTKGTGRVIVQGDSDFKAISVQHKTIIYEKSARRAAAKLKGGVSLSRNSYCEKDVTSSSFAS